MGEITDFTWRRFAKTVEELFNQSRELKDNARALEETNVTDLTEILELK